jgi:ATP-dependent DNA ligase
VQSCLIDGEAIVCNGDGLGVFDLIREYRHDSAAVLCAFDLLACRLASRTMKQA